MDIRNTLDDLMISAIKAAMDDGAFALEEVPDPALERPRDESMGDWASTVAMRNARLAKMPPRDMAQAIVGHIPENDVIAGIEIAGPGFINIHLTPAVLQDVVRVVREEGADYGRSEVAEGERYINLEYVSANPTGPLHVGHGRWATLGDAMARVMRHAGYDVYEEFYINDHGNQMNVFGNSVAVRYMQLLGYDVEMPEECYGGSYVGDIAQQIIDRDGDKYAALTDHERMEIFREIAYLQMLEDQKSLLARYGTTFDRWFSERTLYEVAKDDKSAVDMALEAMRSKGYVYEKDGATWFRSTAFGDSKDRVLIKENGEFTYFTSDVAYHYDKIMRGFDKLIDLWGADHHGYIKRCEAMLEAWGYPGALEVVLGQLVNLLRDGAPVRMSKRTGEMVTFEELIDEVGVDSTRFLMLSRSSDQPIDFDIEVAKKRDNTNPVYYVQYAHARICSILRKAAGEDEAQKEEAGAITMEELARSVAPLDIDLSVLDDPSELALIRKIAEFGELVALAARDRAPFRLTHYAQDLASLFHQFYTNCRVIVDDEGLRAARLALCDATRITLALTLSLLGVSAPEKM